MHKGSVRRAAGRVLACRPLRVGFVVATVTLGVVAVAGEWAGIRTAAARLSVVSLVGAFAVIVASLLISMALWRLVLAGLGSALPYPAAARVLFVGQLGKYLPGSVWPVVAQMELGRDHGVPRRRSVLAFALVMLFTFACALVVATGFVPLADAVQVRPYRPVFLLTPVVVALMHPRVLNPLLHLAARLAHRPAPERPLGWRLSARAVGVGVTQWLVYGVHVWLLGVQLGADPLRLLPLAIGGFALAWAVGFLGVITPAGLGLREVALVLVLLPVLTRADAIVVALASRVLITLADLLLAGVTAAAPQAVRSPVRTPVA